ncbi:MAG: membrane protein insertion efficiency factor YidD [Acidobacteriota bacterium]
MTRAPGRQWTARVVLFAIDGYQAVLSPRMSGLGIQCRFEPTCSHYTEAAIRHRGLVPGIVHGTRRIARCGPWTPLGTIDPPPGPIDPPQSTTTAEDSEVGTD